MEFDVYLTVELMKSSRLGLTILDFSAQDGCFNVQSSKMGSQIFDVVAQPNLSQRLAIVGVLAMYDLQVGFCQF